MQVRYERNDQDGVFRWFGRRKVVNGDKSAGKEPAAPQEDMNKILESDQVKSRYHRRVW